MTHISAFSKVQRLLCMLALGLTACLASASALAQGQGKPGTEPVSCHEDPSTCLKGSAGPYVPTPWPIVDEMFKMANIKKDDFLIDIGSGDGRLVITAAKRFGARGLGIDIQAPLVKVAKENAVKEGVADRVEFVVGDIFETDLLSKASIITVYLLPSIMDKLVPKLQRDLKPGTRIVSHDYALTGMTYDKVEEFNFKEKVAISGTTRTVLYHYVVPPKPEAKPEVKPMAKPAAAKK